MDTNTHNTDRWTWTHVTLYGANSVEETDEFEVPDFDGFTLDEVKALAGTAEAA